MATLRRGDTGAGVESLQEALNKAGANLTVDGKFGPLTEKALRAYQAENGYQVNGAVGGTLYGLMGLSTAGAKPDYTDPEATRFNGLPGKPEIWKNSDTGKWFAVYYVPGSKPPLPMFYSIPNKDALQSFFGDKDAVADRTVKSSQMKATGGVEWGSTAMIPKEERDPWAGFMARMDRMKETNPWLEDPEVFAVQSAAWLEGREVEKWEFEATEWWQSKNEAQQDYMWLVARSPEEAKKIWEQNYIVLHNQFTSVGILEPPESVLRYIADQYSQGNWSQEYVNEQIEAVLGGTSAVGLDDGLGKLIKEGGITIEDPTVKVTQVRDSFDKWLGPLFAPNEKQIQEWAGRLRQNPEAGLDALTEHLRKQRLALFPEYEDDSLTYDDIASPWRRFQSNAWGVETVDEKSDVFQKLVKTNDTTEGGKLLRREGLRQGVEKVEDDAVSELGDEVSQVREAV